MLEQLQAQVDAGFALLFTDAAAAERYLGGRVHPAPLGNVSKVKPDGTRKHRVIQDLRANRVNDSVTLPERQVLPRGVDHAIDVALLLDEAVEDEDVANLSWTSQTHSTACPYTRANSVLTAPRSTTT